VATPAAAGAGRSSARAQPWYESNPTYVDPRDDTADWAFSSPEDQAMDGALLAAAGDSLADQPSILSLLVVRHGHLVYERYYHGSARDQSNNVHSASKSILQALLAIAVRRGEIGGWNDRVSAYLPKCFGGSSAAKRRITIRHLMTMSSGLRWTEDRTEYRLQNRRDWVRATLAAPLRHRPGQRFAYSTGNTHVASAVLQRATGMRTSDFARRYLFGPLGITAEHWGHDPRGVDSGGYNVYLTPRELAKFGMLYAQRGVWKGQRILPVAAVTRAATVVWRVDGHFNYTTGWWQRTLSGHDMYFAWGWGGQFVYVIPDLDVVMVTTENTADGHRNVEIDSRRLLRRVLIPSITR
jgi:CubicO group peptidase (beta-lactamase class C family)